MFHNFGPKFTEEVHSLIKLANSFDIKLFFIDPIILYNTLENNEKKMLIQREIITESILKSKDNPNENSISFGIFQNDVQKLEVSFF